MTSYGYRQLTQNLVIIGHVVPEIGDILADRQTHKQTYTDLHCTILRFPTGGRRSSNENEMITSSLLRLLASKRKV